MFWKKIWLKFDAIMSISLSAEMDPEPDDEPPLVQSSVRFPVKTEKRSFGPDETNSPPSKMPHLMEVLKRPSNVGKRSFAKFFNGILTLCEIIKYFVLIVLQNIITQATITQKSTTGFGHQIHV